MLIADSFMMEFILGNFPMFQMSYVLLRLSAQVRWNYFLNVIISHSGTYLCAAENDAGTVTEEIKINVLCKSCIFIVWEKITIYFYKF